MKKILKILVLIALIFTFLLPVVGQAVDNKGFGFEDSDTWLGKMSLSKLEGGGVAEIIVTIINALLGLLALIAVCLIIYAGFSYMFSGGDPEKMKKARGVISTSVIGLVIIISGYAIANFAFTALNQATGGESSDVNMNTGPGLSGECASVGGRACVPLGGTWSGYNIQSCEDARIHIYNTGGKYDDEIWENLVDECEEAYSGVPGNLANTCFCDQGKCCGVAE